MSLCINAHLIQSDNAKTGNKIGEECIKVMNGTMKKHISHVNLEFDGTLIQTMVIGIKWSYKRLDKYRK